MGRPAKSIDKQLERVLKLVGSNIVFYRKLKGISQAELARRAKISTTTLNEIETKRFRDIRVSTLISLASSLGISLIKIFAEQDVKIESTDQRKLLKASEDIQRILEKIKS